VGVQALDGGVNLPPELLALVEAQRQRGRWSEISLRAIERRWTTWFKALPELDEMSTEQVERGREMLKIDEMIRLRAVIDPR
jgi:hypothetical protein